MAYRPQVLSVPNGGSGDSTLTNHGVLIGAATGNISITAAGSAGQVLQSGGASADPSYSTATYPSSSGSSGNLLTSDGTNWISSAPTAGSSFSMIVTAGNPLDSTTYYFGLLTSLSSSTASGIVQQRLVIAKNGTITACVGFFRIVGTLGSNENTTINIRLNNTTDIAVTTTAQLTANPTNFSNTSLSQAVSAGDYIEITMVTPAWNTNPTSVSASLTVFISS